MLPQGFTAIDDARTAGETHSFLGVVINVKDPTMTTGTDWVLEFSFQDDFSDGSFIGQSSMNCRMFATQRNLPKFINGGDLVIIRNFKLNSWRGRVDCINADKTRSGLIVFPASKISGIAPSSTQSSSKNLQFETTGLAKSPTDEEQKAILDLHKAAAKVMPQVKQHAVVSSFKQSTVRDKLSLIKDLDFSRFYDLKVQIVNLYYTQFSTVELKVTDYTSHKDLFLYEDPDDPDQICPQGKWAGPYGQFTMDVRLYGNNAAWARSNAQKGDYVYLRNVRTKISPANKLEGALHEDRENPDQTDIRNLLNSEDIREINKRREAYEEKRASKWASVNVSKESAKSAGKKKHQKKQRQRQAKSRELQEVEKKAEEDTAVRLGINPHVRAGYPDVKLSAVSEIKENPSLIERTTKNNILNLPFINCKYRARARVVDFFPPKIEQFSRSVDDPKWNDNLGKKNDVTTLRRRRWEWSFALLLEDAHAPPGSESERLSIVVGDSEGQHLLKMNAAELATDSGALQKLEEKLFILWGNCLELKNELIANGSDLPLPSGDPRLQNKPFDCCIEEYGIEIPITKFCQTGFKRMHKPFATTIMG